MRLALLAGALLPGLILHGVWQLAGGPSQWPRRYLRLVARIIGMRVRIIGVPLRGRVLFVSNHLSWLDIPILAGETGAAFVSKAEVSGWPLIGFLARQNRTVFIERAERGSVRGQADALRTALSDGRPVALFPEGTTDGGTEVLPFRPSLLASLFPPLAGVTVQPVAIDYGEAGPDIAWVGDEPALANARRILSRRGGTRVTLHFLAPLEPGNAGDRKALAAGARGEIVAALASARAHDQL